MTTTSTYPHLLTLPSDREIRVERVFNAPRERVWRAMTEPDQIAQWWGRGNKLTVEFEKAGEKKVIDSFVEKQG